MDEDAARIMQKILFADGWSRLPVDGTVVLLIILASEGPLSREDLHLSLACGRDARGLDEAAWEELHVYTDQELVDLDEEFAGTPFGSEADEPLTAAKANADEQRRRERQVAEMRQYAIALGVGEVHTLRDLLDFLVAAGVVLEQEAGELVLNPQAPLPAEVLPLDDEEVARQDEMRWARLHEGIVNDLIALFRPSNDVRVVTLQGTLLSYAGQLERDAESIRAAVEQLLDAGDFTADVDVRTVPTDEEFHLTVDWGRFARTRIAVRRGE